MKITDGKKTVEIKMMVWEEGRGYSPDWSDDFFCAGSLQYDEEIGAHRVQDVDYCIEQAHDWEKSIGDFCNDEPNDGNTVFVDYLETPKTTYSYRGLFPYSAADLYAMDQFVEDGFVGNVTEELIKNGAVWDDEAKTLTVPGMASPVDFV